MAWIGLIGTIITAIGSLTAVIVTNRANNEKMLHQMELQQVNIRAELKQAQAVTDTKIDELTREVREHNNFAKRVPVIEEQIKVANHRIEDLERKRNEDMRLYKTRVRQIPERLQFYRYRTTMLRPESTRQDQHAAGDGAERLREHDISRNAPGAY